MILVILFSKSFQSKVYEKKAEEKTEKLNPKVIKK